VRQAESDKDQGPYEIELQHARIGKRIKTGTGRHNTRIKHCRRGEQEEPSLEETAVLARGYTRFGTIWPSAAGNG